MYVRVCLLARFFIQKNKRTCQHVLRNFENFSITFSLSFQIETIMRVLAFPLRFVCNVHAFSTKSFRVRSVFFFFFNSCRLFKINDGNPIANNSLSHSIGLVQRFCGFFFSFCFFSRIFVY